MSDFHSHVRPEPTGAVLRAPLPPRRRAEDHLQFQAITAAFDDAVDRGEHSVSFAVVERICRIYHAQLVARGGRL